jgi:hypothetical protein
MENLSYFKGKSVRRFSKWDDTNPEDLARLSYGDLKDLEAHQTPEPTDFLMPEYLSGSDYCSSGAVEVSNHRVFLERYSKLPNVYDVYGGYGTFAVAIRLDSVTPEMVEDFEALDNYPVLDEDDHSEVEMDSENEAWDSFVRHDFEQALTKQFPALEDTIEELSTDQVWSLFLMLMDRTNTYWEHESGNNAFVRVERLVEGATEQDLRSTLTK